jgi:hypothetical protein
MAWVLRAIREAFGDQPVPESFVEWKFFESVCAGLLVWEAFVSKGAHAQPDGDPNRNLHWVDARTGVETFEKFLADDGSNESHVVADGPLSLAGAALIWSDLSEDPHLVRQHGLVLKAG